MNEYTPTTNDVRHAYSWADSDADGPAFDRWLASVKAEAWDEGATDVDQMGLAANNPYREQP